MNNLKVPTCDLKVVVYCKDNHKLIGQVNIAGYERFSDYYKKVDVLNMYNVKGIQDGYKNFMHSYVAVERCNIILAIPLKEE